jgi:hypothetical protein
MSRFPSVLLLLAALPALAGCGGGRAEAATIPGPAYRFRVAFDDVPSAEPWTSLEGAPGFAIGTSRQTDNGAPQDVPTGATPFTAVLEADFGRDNLADVRSWVQQVYDGGSVKKKITISVVDQAGDTVRTFNLIDCYPVSLSLVNLDLTAADSVLRWRLEVRVNRVETL